MVLPVTEMMSSLGLAEIKWSCRRTSWERHLFLILPGSVSLAHRRKNDIESSIRGKEQYFQGRLVPIITATIIRSRKATVSRARCAGAPSCRKTKSHPGISRICMAVVSGEEDCRDAPLTLTPGSINGFQCCQVSKHRLALFTHLVLLCLTRQCGETSEVRWEMYIWYKTLANLLSSYQKLLKLMDI